MDKATKYDLKEAYNKNLTDKARLHYLENVEHNVHSRKGYAGSYSEIPVPTSPIAPIVPAANTAPMAPVAPEQLAAPTYYKKY
jgi:hypothetical protein